MSADLPAPGTGTPEPPRVWWDPEVPMWLLVDRGETRPGQVEVWTSSIRHATRGLPDEAVPLFPEGINRCPACGLRRVADGRCGSVLDSCGYRAADFPAAAVSAQGADTTDGWRVLDPDDPARYPDGFAVVSAAWNAETDRAEHYVAERMTRATAEVLVAALSSGGTEPRHEVACPECGATIRARMADVPASSGDTGTCVAALLKRCEEIDRTTWRADDDPAGDSHIATSEVWRLLAVSRSPQEETQ